MCSACSHCLLVLQCADPFNIHRDQLICRFIVECGAINVYASRYIQKTPRKFVCIRLGFRAPINTKSWPDPAASWALDCHCECERDETAAVWRHASHTLFPSFIPDRMRWPKIVRRKWWKYPALFISIETIALFLLILISVMFDSMVKSFTRLFPFSSSSSHSHCIPLYFLRNIWMTTTVDDDASENEIMNIY